MDKNSIREAINNNRMKNLASSNKPNNQYPSISQMAKNLGNDVIKTVHSVATGTPLNADDAEANRRKSICNGCEAFDKQQERCTKCGCYMAVKVYLKAANCPIGKW
jgi:hypothetical protein